MNADGRGFKHAELTQTVIRAFFDVYNTLGHGFLESVYEAAMVIALREAGLSAVRQAPVPVYFHGESVGDFRADLIVEGVLILELKAAKALDTSHEAQVLNYLKATSIEVGFLLNFGPKPEFKRFAFDNDRKQIRVHLRSSAAGSDSEA